MQYPYATSPEANPEAIVSGENFRITVLTSRLFRIEYNPGGSFENRATQTVINRQFPLPAFSVSDAENLLTIQTDDVTIRYNKQSFSSEGLIVSLNGSEDINWSYNPENPDNLLGTARTLDRVDGPCELEKGMLSKNGAPTILDDSASLIIEQNGEIVPRPEQYTDQYLFCYGLPNQDNDHKAALKAFYQLTGHTPLIPRFALGNWWSRYYAYTQEEYANLMKRFKDEGIPFSVAVIDIGWHLQNIDKKYGTGWSGYTWNEELFPDHVALLRYLHDEGLKVSLNLHPDEGIAAHEKPYKKMAEAMGIDPETEETVKFDIASPQFIENYFKILHHPLEDEGVDFWWIDWQQGTKSSIPGLDPLWMLNHFHTVDNTRRGNRPLIFSRYAGPGSHRYPLGFSGDTIMTWESLRFQPYFTATASNIGFGWWSHDIGGHMWGYRDSELYVRWLQLGVFSPINRLHSTISPFMNKEPWYYDKNTEYCLKKFLNLRHQLIPYLYTMNHRAHTEDEPLVQPLYYNYRSKLESEPEYTLRNEYTFGTEMLVSPITVPADKETVCGCAKTYFPEGMWYDFFTNDRYCGEKVLDIYRTADKMPVFVKAGGIIPLAVPEEINDIKNPGTLQLKVFAGADNTFTLYEDDGETDSYQSGNFALTKIDMKWSKRPRLSISRPEGIFAVGSRNFMIELIGINKNTDISITEDGIAKDCQVHWANGVLSLSVPAVSGELNIYFLSDVTLKPNDILTHAESFLRFAEMDNQLKVSALNAIKEANTSDEQIEKLENLELSRDIKNALIEIIRAEE